MEDKLRDILNNHLFKLTDKKAYGMCSPVTEYATMCHELITFFLGEGWYVGMPQSDKRCMTSALYEIERQYFGVGDKKYKKKIIAEYKKDSEEIKKKNRWKNK